MRVTSSQNLCPAQRPGPSGSNAPGNFLKILMVGAFPSCDAPNKAIFNRRAAERLGAGADVTFVQLRQWRPGRALRKVSAEGFGKLVTLSVPSPPLNVVRLAPKALEQATLICFRELGWKLVRDFVYQSDVVHSIGASLAGISCSSWSARAGTPHVCQVIGTDVNLELARMKGYWVVKNWLQNVAMVVCNSDALREAFLGIYPGFSPVRRVYRGTDVQQFNPCGPSQWSSPDRRGMRFLYLGGVPEYSHLRQGSDIKGGKLLMRAWSEVEGAPSLKGTTLVFAGPGADAPFAKQWWRNLSAPERVQLAGPLAPHDVTRYLRGADVVLIPSRFEGLPNVAVEAAASGTAVIANDVGGIPEIVVNGRTGLLVDSNATDAWISALKWAVARPETIAAMGREA